MSEKLIFLSLSQACIGNICLFVWFVVLGPSEACIGVLGIQDICHFTSRDIGYFPFYFQGYGILCSIFGFLSGILNILEN